MNEKVRKTGVYVIGAIIFLSGLSQLFKETGVALVCMGLGVLIILNEGGT